MPLPPPSYKVSPWTSCSPPPPPSLLQGLSLDSLFEEADLVHDVRSDVLAGVRRVHPDYMPSPVHTYDTPCYTTRLAHALDTLQVSVYTMHA